MEVATTTTAARTRGGAAALRPQSGTVPSTPADTSEPPLAQRRKMNGLNSHSHTATQAPELPTWFPLPSRVQQHRRRDGLLDSIRIVKFLVICV
jgi:hypothetical protein